MQNVISTIKLGTYNECPGSERAERYLIDYIDDRAPEGAKVKYVDLVGVSYWVNKDDTLVLAIPDEAGTRAGIGLTELVAEIRPDEVDTKRGEGVTYVRLWWD